MITVFHEYHSPVCDGCGKHLGAERSDAAAEEAMNADGWAKIGGKDYCRLCQREAERTGKLPEPGNMWEFTKHIAQRTAGTGGTPHPSPSATPSPQGEGKGGEKVATPSPQGEGEKTDCRGRGAASQ